MAKKDPYARLRELIKRRASQTHDCLETCLENVSRGPQRDADGLVCSKLAELGYLEQRKEARRLDFPWNEWTSANAAMNGHLKCLKYAHEHGCPWDETQEMAAENGHEFMSMDTYVQYTNN